MQVQILDENGEVIWSHGKKCGMTFLSHREDGKIEEIVELLEVAAETARCEQSNSSQNERQD